MQAIDWTTVGSGATALATFAAFLTIYITVRNYRKDLERQQSALIRQSLHTLKNQSPILLTVFKGGSVLFLSSLAVAKELRSRLGPSAGRQEFWHYLNGDDQHWLSVAAVGWYSSSQHILPLDTIRPMEQSIPSLTGGLLLLSYPVQLLRDIIADTYSPNLFYNSFSAMKETRAFFQKNGEEKDIDKLIDELTIELQGYVSAYFLFRYDDAVKQLNDFITDVSDNLLKLDDRKLVKISRIKSRDTSAQTTRTGSMKESLKDIKQYLSKEIYNTSLKLISEIDKSLSREGARDKLENKKQKYTKT